VSDSIYLYAENGRGVTVVLCFLVASVGIHVMHLAQDLEKEGRRRAEHVPAWGIGLCSVFLAFLYITALGLEAAIPHYDRLALQDVYVISVWNLFETGAYLVDLFLLLLVRRACVTMLRSIQKRKQANA
jgi:hypothetical protein